MLFNKINTTSLEKKENKNAKIKMRILLTHLNLKTKITKKYKQEEK
ncbi:hypothetical protein PPE03_21700 [Pseudoalteromonas peptidolytica]|nr:hypothetical protein PPE03_21700 [Pseudoalteromonas peptidolytica]